MTQRQIPQTRQRHSHAEEFRFGVGVGCEALVAAARLGLGRKQRAARLQEVLAKGVPRGMIADREAAIGGLDDDRLAAAFLDAGQAGKDRIMVKDADEPVGDVNQRLAAAERRWA